MEEYHQVRFDNLYMLAKYALGSFLHPKKVMIEGVSRTSNRGVPTQIHQQEVTTRSRIGAVKETVKACVLEGVPALERCPLIACLIYDTKPVHFFSMCCVKIEWIEKICQTWDKCTSTLRLGCFLCLVVNV